jgi:hypothetical protein
MRRNQLGHRLGTSLVELGFVDLDTIARALSAQHRVPAVLAKHVAAIEPKIIAMLPGKVAVAHHAVPLGLTQSEPARLVVALRDPHGTPVEELAFVAGMRIEVAVAPELLVKRCLAQYYPEQSDKGWVDLAGPSVQTVEEPAPPTPVVASAPPASSKRPAGVATLSAPPPPADFTPLPATAPGPEMIVDVDDAIGRLASAPSRDAIADIIVDYMKYRFECGLVLIVKDATALGWKGFAAEADAVESVAVPLVAPSMFKDPFETHRVFRGPPPDEGAALQTRLWKQLKEKPPDEVIVAPIVLGKRVINLLYAHPAPDSPDNFTKLAAAAAVEYARVIKAKK